MAHQTLSITFTIQAQEWRDGQFTIPIEYCRLLEVDQGDKVLLFIRLWNGHHPVFTGTEELKSGNEVYSDKLRDAISAGDQIIVEVSAVK
jgi:bifunctional DNA-binding transcriptional regulator/antitoxin component of YhaV-PrlF toxin-antitoxin module